MRLWSLHPEYLDAKGLLAAWREGLLAQKVLEGKTKGYRNHPQLDRFRKAENTEGIMGLFLLELAQEAERRGYKFDKTKIHGTGIITVEQIPVSDAQVRYEFELLKSKLERRDINKLSEIKDMKEIKVNSVFRKEPGGIEAWEKVIQGIRDRMEFKDGI